MFCGMTLFRIMVQTRLLLQFVFLLCLIGGCVAEINTEDYIVQTSHLPDDVRFRPPIGNGHIATNILSDTVYMNGLFNGYEDRSSRARIPAYVSVDVTKEHDVNRSYILDMYNGFFQQKVEKPDCHVVVTYMAHRTNTCLLVTMVTVERKVGHTGNISVKLTNNRENVSADFDTVTHRDENGMSGPNVKYYHGRNKEPELNNTKSSELHVFYTSHPPELVLSNGDAHSFIFIASHSEHRQVALDSYNRATVDAETLLDTHKEAWHAIWGEGRIDIEGNHGMSQNVIAATYNILCSLPIQDDPSTPFFGLSPGGLSRGGLLVPNMPGGGNNDYAGHVFWDMDTWMMPPIMLFHPKMGRSMIGARTRVLEQVKENARNAGFKGAKFPWEQATTGIEATPKWAGQMSRFEIHINADISYSLRQYLYANDDVSLITSQRGFELAMEIARFWESRANRTGSDTVEILGVMGPDEYHYNIDNSVYTNYNAKMSLLLPQFIVDRFDLSVNASIQAELDVFNKTADDMLILFDDQLQYHPQYEGFNLSYTIKQSDVVLLGYPLMMPMSRAIRRNDLKLYEEVTDKGGPDTGTWSMHTVGWLELGEETRAYDSFKMMLRNINEPFKVFSEKPVTNTSTGGCVNFITAAGGLLQSVVFGYGGIRLEPNTLVIHPSPLPETTGFSVIGIHYRSSVLNFHFNGTSKVVTIDVTKPDDVSVFIMLDNGENPQQTEINGIDAISYVNQRAVIEVKTGIKSSGLVTSHPESKASSISAHWIKGMFSVMYYLTLSSLFRS